MYSYLCWILSTPVPIATGMPIMMHSLTPSILSSFPFTEALKRWSDVFSNEANINTLLSIFWIPNLVIPRTTPCYNIIHILFPIKWIFRKVKQNPNLLEPLLVQLKIKDNKILTNHLPWKSSHLLKASYDECLCSFRDFPWSLLSHQWCTFWQPQFQEFPGLQWYDYFLFSDHQHPQSP